MKTKTLKTACEQITGLHKDDICGFLGIRYATSERWGYPEAVKHWDGVLDATGYGPSAYQGSAFAEPPKPGSPMYFYNREFFEGAPISYSEDCLRLNIYTPSEISQKDKLPVIMFIHGGAFTNGSSYEKEFLDPALPGKGVIVVFIQYRLGPLGFCNFPDVIEKGGRTGNYAVYDCIEALRWLKSNINAFGGNPDNITIMGQSAGGGMCRTLCHVPEAKGLFNKVVFSSYITKKRTVIPERGDSVMNFWKEFISLLGVETAEEARRKPLKDIYAAWGRLLEKEMLISTRLGGPVDVGLSDKLIDCPAMLGSTSEDLWPDEFETGIPYWSTLVESPVYGWYFSRQLPGDDNGAWHSADLWYWFGTFKNCWRPMEKRDYELSDRMMSYLANFAATGNPNGEGLPEWADVRTGKVLGLS